MYNVLDNPFLINSTLSSLLTDLWMRLDWQSFCWTRWGFEQTVVKMTAQCKCWTYKLKGSVMGLGRVLHWGPLVAIGEPSNFSIEALFWDICQCHHTICLILGIIKWVSLATIYCGTMWWPPAESIGGLLFLSSFLFFAGGLNNEPQQTRKEREIDKKKLSHNNGF